MAERNGAKRAKNIFQYGRIKIRVATLEMRILLALFSNSNKPTLTYQI